MASTANQLQIFRQNFDRNVSWKVLLQPYIFGPLLICISCHGNHNAKKWKKKIKYYLVRNHNMLYETVT